MDGLKIHYNKFHSLSETQLTHSYVHIKLRHLKLRSGKTNSITGNCKNWVITAVIQYVGACLCLNIIKKCSKYLRKVFFYVGKLVRQTRQTVKMILNIYIHTHIYGEREHAAGIVFFHVHM